MAANATAVAAPSLWDATRHELFKGRKQRFYVVTLLLPLVLGLIFALLLGVIKILNPPSDGLPTIDAGGSYDLGPGGGFAFASTVMFSGIASVYVLVLILAAILSVANEYRWNTIKMLAIRQPNRAALVLSKCLFAGAVVGGAFLSFVAGWALLALALKVFYSLPLSLTADDWASIGGGLRYFALANLHTFILALLVVALAFHFKSIVGALIGYLIYTTFDSQISGMGTAVANGGLRDAPDWLRPILEFFRVLNPFLLTSNINRVAMREQIVPPFGAGPGVPNPQIVLGTPVGWAWLVLAVYIVLFTALAVGIFARRDITD